MQAAVGGLLCTALKELSHIGMCSKPVSSSCNYNTCPAGHVTANLVPADLLPMGDVLRVSIVDHLQIQKGLDVVDLGMFKKYFEAGHKVDSYCILCTASVDKWASVFARNTRWTATACSALLPWTAGQVFLHGKSLPFSNCSFLLGSTMYVVA